LNPQEIADTIRYIIDNPDIAEEMGKNGKKAVMEKYNWANEERKLLSLYKRLS
jgi:glycosyltransferase involved in cell wall biosynthesis